MDFVLGVYLGVSHPAPNPDVGPFDFGEDKLFCVEAVKPVDDPSSIKELDIDELNDLTNEDL